MRQLIRLLGGLLLGATLLALAGGGALAWMLHRYGEGLPDYSQLAEYAPPTVTRIHAGDGRLLAEYARERRVFVPIAAIPDRVKQAFIAAEDQNFYQHPGIDPIGILRAAVTNLRAFGSAARPQGASTITQQVAKNFLVGNELSLERKIKEAVLAVRMERAFTKDHILELYLNQIFLGNRSYGVAAAALNYFDKSLDELTIAEAAFLAALPKAPSRYDPERATAAATARRDYVIGRMLADGYINRIDAQTALGEPLTTRERAPTEFAHADFFTEAVRRQLVERFGEDGFYEGGLSVRTTVQPRLQDLADRALRRGLANYDRRHGWRGPLGHLDPVVLGKDWRSALAAFDAGFETLSWQQALVLENGADGAVIGFADGTTATLPFSEMNWARTAGPDDSLGPRPRRPDQIVAVGDIVLVEWIDGDDKPARWTLRQRPNVEGAIVAMDPHTGRILAMSGGFSFRQSKFDRVTQALRQPGSSFKPFVYLAGLEHGYTPASIIIDGPIEVDLGPEEGVWRPQNYSEKFYGPSTLRLGLEKSRNLMTVRLAMDIGMNGVVDVARRFDIAHGLQPYLSGALGASEVDLLHLTTAYAMLVNGGRRITPAFVERIQDRNGITVMRRDSRACQGCRQMAWEGQQPPALPENRELVEDPRYAFQMVNMLRGVVERGTAAAANVLNRPLAGKTGTSNDSKDAWFIGFSPDLVVGVWVGYDQPKSLGEQETGASAALPIWIEFMRAALDGQPRVPFRTPPGISLVKVDAATGLLPGPATSSVISEAFLPGTEPFQRSAGRQPAAGGGRTEDGTDGAARAPATLPGNDGIY